MKKIIFFIFVFLFIFSSKVNATTFDLYVSTQPPYNRGQEITFTININTEGATLNNTSIGMTYDTQYLQYLNTIPAGSFETVTTDNLGDGKLVFYGSSTNGFSGQGKFVDVVFKLIAQAPGSTELCVLWNPQQNPTPTTAPQPTSLPRSGNNNPFKKAGIMGAVFIFLTTNLFLLNQIKSRKISLKRINKNIKPKPYK